MKTAFTLTTLTAFTAMFSSSVFAQDADIEVVELVAEDDDVMVDEVLVAMPVDDDQLKLMTYAKVELALVRRACDLSDQQLKDVAQINDKWVTKINNEQLQRINVNAQQPGLIAMFFGARPQVNNRQQASKKGVKVRIDERIAETLTDEQKQIYEKEKESRHKFRSQAIADALVESLQPRLGLTEQQRAQIKTKITPWAARLEVHTMYYFSGNNYYPDIPEHYLTPILDKEQVVAYRGLQRHLFTEENFNDGNAPIVIKQ